MKIGVVSARDGGVDYHRLLRPFAAIHEMGHSVTRYDSIPLAHVADIDADVVVFNRCLWADSQAEVITALQARGIRVICDVDDYWVLPSSHILYRDHKAITPKIAEAVTMADQVWVTHELLATRARILNDNVVIVPNGIAIQDEQWQVTPLPFDTTVGYIGGATHAPDMAVTDGAWKHYTGKRVLCGLSVSAAAPFQVMAAIMSNRGNLPIEIGEARAVTDYGTFYDGVSIAVAPLADNAFNRCKSNLKILEAGAKGRPIFAQMVHPYFPFKNDGVIHVTNWADAMKRIQVMGDREIKERGAALRTEIEANHTIDIINQIRLHALNG